MAKIKARQIDTGTNANQLVELDGNGDYPASNGGAITSVNAITVGGDSAADLHDAAQLTGSVADARITESSVTQHEAALDIGGGQVTSAVANATNATNATNASDATEWNGSAKTISTSGPSGGSDGDIWYQYE